MRKTSAALAFRVAYGVLHRREDAEDVAQEALARAYHNLGRLRDRERRRKSRWTLGGNNSQQRYP